MKKMYIVLYFILTRWIRRLKTREKIDSYQEKKINKQLKYMRKHSDYIRELGEKPLEELPLMDKQVMMTHFDRLNTVGVEKEKAFELALRSEEEREFNEQYGDISVGLSSGTSGHRGLFLTSEREQGVWAGTILAKLLPKKQMLGHKISFFLRANNNLYETIDSKALEFRYFDMYRPFQELVDELLEYQPTILVAPASVLVDLAKEIEKRQALLKPIKVLSVAEVLEEKDAAYLKEIFQQSIIHQIYQCTEGFLGCTCEEGHLHINEDMVKIEKEWIDDKRFYPIITDFTRTSQPIIRYRLNDILVENKEPCPCGSAFLRLEKIEGRSDDVFEFKGIHQEIVRVYPDFIRRVILYAEDIMEYQVAQIANDCIDIRVNDLTSEAKQVIENRIDILSEELRFERPTIQYSPYKRDRERKLKRVVKEIGDRK
jgi:putative adenylate-forming enzyme